MKALLFALAIICTPAIAQTIQGVEVGTPSLVIEDQDGNIIVLSEGQCKLYGKPAPGAIATIILSDGPEIRGCAGKIEGKPVIVTEHQGGYGVIPIDITRFKKSNSA